MRRLVVSLCIVVLILIGVLSASANPLPDPPRLLPLRSAEELQSVLAGRLSPEFVDALSQAEILGPQYTWLLAELAQRDDLSLPFQSVLRGLAENGALDVLEAVRADTSRPAYVRAGAREALHKARADSTAPSDLTGRDRTLLAFRGEFVCFAFLLDDIASISYIERFTQAEYPIDEGEFRDLCDVLQTGTRVPAGELVAQGELVFRMKDGREAAVPTDGTIWGGVGGGMLSCPSLGEFVRQRVRHSRSDGEPPN